MLQFLNERIAPKEFGILLFALFVSIALPFIVNKKLFGDDLKLAEARFKNISKNITFTNAQISSLGKTEGIEPIKRRIKMLKSKLRKKGVDIEANTGKATTSIPSVDSRAEIKNAQIVNILQRSRVSVRSTKPGRTGNAANSRSIEATGTFPGLRNALIGLESANVNVDNLKIINNTETGRLSISLSLTF